MRERERKKWRWSNLTNKVYKKREDAGEGDIIETFPVHKKFAFFKQILFLSILITTSIYFNKFRHVVSNIFHLVFVSQTNYLRRIKIV